MTTPFDPGAPYHEGNRSWANWWTYQFATVVHDLYDPTEEDDQLNHIMQMMWCEFSEGDDKDLARCLRARFSPRPMTAAHPIWDSITDEVMEQVDWQQVADALVAFATTGQKVQ
jgi:hypothetical protein